MSMESKSNSGALKYLSIAELSSITGVNEYTLQLMEDKGYLTAKIVDGTHLFPNTLLGTFNKQYDAFVEYMDKNVSDIGYTLADEYADEDIEYGERATDSVDESDVLSEEQKDNNNGENDNDEEIIEVVEENEDLNVERRNRRNLANKRARQEQARLSRLNAEQEAERIRNNNEIEARRIQDKNSAAATTHEQDINTKDNNQTDMASSMFAGKSAIQSVNQSSISRQSTTEHSVDDEYTKRQKEFSELEDYEADKLRRETESRRLADEFVKQHNENLKKNQEYESFGHKGVDYSGHEEHYNNQNTESHYDAEKRTDYKRYNENSDSTGYQSKSSFVDYTGSKDNEVTKPNGESTDSYTSAYDEKNDFAERNKSKSESFDVATESTASYSERKVYVEKIHTERNESYSPSSTDAKGIGYEALHQNGYTHNDAPVDAAQQAQSDAYNETHNERSESTSYQAKDSFINDTKVNYSEAYKPSQDRVGSGTVAHDSRVDSVKYNESRSESYRSDSEGRTQYRDSVQDRQTYNAAPIDAAQQAQSDAYNETHNERSESTSYQAKDSFINDTKVNYGEAYKPSQDRVGSGTVAHDSRVDSVKYNESRSESYRSDSEGRTQYRDSVQDRQTYNAAPIDAAQQARHDAYDEAYNKRSESGDYHAINSFVKKDGETPKPSQERAGSAGFVHDTKTDFTEHSEGKLESPRTNSEDRTSYRNSSVRAEEIYLHQSVKTEPNSFDVSHKEQSEYHGAPVDTTQRARSDAYNGTVDERSESGDYHAINSFVNKDDEAHNPAQDRAGSAGFAHDVKSDSTKHDESRLETPRTNSEERISYSDNVDRIQNVSEARVGNIPDSKAESTDKSVDSRNSEQGRQTYNEAPVDTTQRARSDAYNGTVDKHPESEGYQAINSFVNKDGETSKPSQGRTETTQGAEVVLNNRKERVDDTSTSRVEFADKSADHRNSDQGRQMHNEAPIDTTQRARSDAYNGTIDERSESGDYRAINSFVKKDGETPKPSQERASSAGFAHDAKSDFAKRDEGGLESARTNSEDRTPYRDGSVRAEETYSHQSTRTEPNPSDFENSRMPSEASKSFDISHQEQSEYHGAPVDTTQRARSDAYNGTVDKRPESEGYQAIDSFVKKDGETPKSNQERTSSAHGAEVILNNRKERVDDTSTSRVEFADKSADHRNSDQGRQMHNEAPIDTTQRARSDAYNGTIDERSESGDYRAINSFVKKDGETPKPSQERASSAGFVHDTKTDFTEHSEGKLESPRTNSEDRTSYRNSSVRAEEIYLHQSVKTEPNSFDVSHQEQSEYHGAPVDTTQRARSDAYNGTVDKRPESEGYQAIDSFVKKDGETPKPSQERASSAGFAHDAKSDFAKRDEGGLESARTNSEEGISYRDSVDRVQNDSNVRVGDTPTSEAERTDNTAGSMNSEQGRRTKNNAPVDTTQRARSDAYNGTIDERSESGDYRAINSFVKKDGQTPSTAQGKTDSSDFVPDARFDPAKHNEGKLETPRTNSEGRTSYRDSVDRVQNASDVRVDDTSTSKVEFTDKSADPKNSGHGKQTHNDAPVDTTQRARSDAYNGTIDERSESEGYQAVNSFVDDTKANNSETRNPAQKRTDSAHGSEVVINDRMKRANDILSSEVEPTDKSAGSMNSEQGRQTKNNAPVDTTQRARSDAYNGTIDERSESGDYRAINSFVKKDGEAPKPAQVKRSSAHGADVVLNKANEREKINGGYAKYKKDITQAQSQTSHKAGEPTGVRKIGNGIFVQESSRHGVNNETFSANSIKTHTPNANNRRFIKINGTRIVAISTAATQRLFARQTSFTNASTSKEPKLAKKFKNSAVKVVRNTTNSQNKNRSFASGSTFNQYNNKKKHRRSKNAQIRGKGTIASGSTFNQYNNKKKHRRSKNAQIRGKGTTHFGSSANSKVNLSKKYQEAFKKVKADRYGFIRGSRDLFYIFGSAIFRESQLRETDAGRMHVLIGTYSGWVTGALVASGGKQRVLSAGKRISVNLLPQNPVLANSLLVLKKAGLLNSTELDFNKTNSIKKIMTAIKQYGINNGLGDISKMSVAELQKLLKSSTTTSTDRDMIKAAIFFNDFDLLQKNAVTDTMKRLGINTKDLQIDLNKQKSISQALMLISKHCKDNGLSMFAGMTERKLRTLIKSGTLSGNNLELAKLTLSLRNQGKRLSVLKEQKRQQRFNIMRAVRKIFGGIDAFDGALMVAMSARSVKQALRMSIWITKLAGRAALFVTKVTGIQAAGKFVINKTKEAVVSSNTFQKLSTSKTADKLKKAKGKLDGVKGRIQDKRLAFRTREKLTTKIKNKILNKVRNTKVYKVGKVIAKPFKFIAKPFKAINKAFSTANAFMKKIMLYVAIGVGAFILFVGLFNTIFGAASSAVSAITAFFFGEDDSDVEDIMNSVAGKALSSLLSKDQEWFYSVSDKQYEKPQDSNGKTINGFFDPKTGKLHVIESWGAPLFDSYGNIIENGFEMHYYNGDGVEIGERSNAKEILSCAHVYMQGDYTEKSQYNKYVNALWESSHTYALEISSVYRCTDGCSEFAYCCNETTIYDHVKNDNLQVIGDIMPYAEYGCKQCSDSNLQYCDGCIKVTYGDSEIAVCPGHHVKEDGKRCDNEVYIDDNSTTIEVSESETVTCGRYECKGHCKGHTAKICLGHANLRVMAAIIGLDEINKRLFDVDTSEPYGEFEGWTKENIDWAMSIYKDDWYDTYGISFLEAHGAPLSDGEINELMSKMPEDTSEERRNLIRWALESVGRIPYYFGGIASAPGYDGNDFGTVVVPDSNGRCLKGLDCSHWVDWVYWSVTGDNLGNGYTGILANVGQEVDYDNLKPGDILVNHIDNGDGTYSGHAAIFLCWVCDDSGNRTGMIYIHETPNNVTVTNGSMDWDYCRRVIPQ